MADDSTLLEKKSTGLINSELGRLNIIRSGELFMYCVWMQGVMIYLLILSQNKKLREKFIAYHSTLEDEFVKIRTELLKKSFTVILSKFSKEFTEISNEELKHLKWLLEFRDMLAHCHISLGRRYSLWGPRGSSLEKRLEPLGLKPELEQTHNLVKFDASDDVVYFKAFSIIKQLDEGIIQRISKNLGIPYGRIR